nr:RNA-dependent RNA polymerase family protein [Tanacetum cinerariifolium]GEX50192.1 RNA-dependent RNA polymerase family protein [Tanacetum cinerariifolium]
NKMEDVVSIKDAIIIRSLKTMPMLDFENWMWNRGLISSIVVEHKRRTYTGVGTSVHTQDVHEVNASSTGTTSDVRTVSTSCGKRKMHPEGYLLKVTTTWELNEVIQILWSYDVVDAILDKTAAMEGPTSSKKHTSCTKFTTTFSLINFHYVPQNKTTNQVVTCFQDKYCPKVLNKPSDGTPRNQTVPQNQNKRVGLAEANWPHIWILVHIKV